MDVHYDGGAQVTLSERNLRDLAWQLEHLGRAELHRMTEEGFLRVLVEGDERHYKDREPGPGTDNLRDIVVLGFET